VRWFWIQVRLRVGPSRLARVEPDERGRCPELESAPGGVVSACCIELVGGTGIEPGTHLHVSGYTLLNEGSRQAGLAALSNERVLP
jgi:hypothetical protein